MKNFNPIKISYPISLYIHIPFCSKKCDYCDFYSIDKYDANLINTVLNEIINQLKYFYSKMGSPIIKTIYIGGGTPSIIPQNDLYDFISKINSIIGNNFKEWTIEVNPETVNENLLKLLNSTNITRISCGIQSFNEKNLKWIGRNSSSKDNYNAIELIGKYWDKDLNYDLICSIPDQTMNSAIYDLDKITKTNCNHISLYTLTIEKNTALWNRKPKINNDMNQTKLWFEIMNSLEKSDFKQYEISNYSKKNKESLHNLAYWNMDPYLGLGPSAVSTLQFENASRLQNPSNINKYLSGQNNLWNMDVEIINNQNLLLEHFIMGLRLNNGININKINQIFNINILEDFNFNNFKYKEYLQFDNGNIYLNKNGRKILNTILLELMDCIDQLEICNVNWPAVIS